MAIVDRVRELVIPVVEAESADLYDVEHNGGVLRVLVDADGGIGIDEIKRISRALSRRLDEEDPMPGRYTLEVSSPGLERPLRTPDHFRCAVGEDVKIKTMPTVDGARRLSGTLVSADDGGFDLQTDKGRCRLRYEEVSKARTVFVWGPGPEPGRGHRGDSPNSSREGSPDTREVPAS
ncbi:MAG: ribosome maturation factor RimP [Acidimicrobiaceae bacterium]|nr:ribosome maturation factor RimP [Acidimicrobiaceae bacterium]MDE0607729.1 ribosome maturation factor RimP [Acidimicrobiaceae bacterium]